MGNGLTRKTVHAAHTIAEDGSVSALCYATPHPIDLKVATWTLVPKLVTCGRCRAAAAKAEREACERVY